MCPCSCLSRFTITLSLGGPGAILSVAADVHNCLLILLAESGREPLWPPVPLCTFEPDIEEIRELGILDVICVGWINYDRGDTLVCQLREACGGSERDLDGVHRVMMSEVADFLIGFENVVNRPLKARSSIARSHLSKGSLESVIVPVHFALDDRGRVLPPCVFAVMIAELVQASR